MYIILSILIIAVGVFFCYARRKLWAGTETYVGVVEGFSEQMGMQGHAVRKLYRAIVRYEKDGKAYTAQHVSAKPREGVLHAMGENVMICVSPSDPKNFVYADESKTSMLGIMFIAVGVMFLLFNIVIELL